MKKTAVLIPTFVILVVVVYIFVTPRKTTPVNPSKVKANQETKVRATPNDHAPKSLPIPPIATPSSIAKSKKLPLNGQYLDAAIEGSGATGDPIDVTGQARTDNIIARLKSETTVQALDNANNVNDFYYPGYFGSAGENSMTAILEVLSNRRTMKLYAELKTESPAQRHEYLKLYFDRFLKAYHDQVLLFTGNGATGVDPDTLHYILGGIGGYNTKNPCVPLAGNLQALRMIIFLAATLQDHLLYPDIENVFKHPVAGFEIDLQDFDPHTKRAFESRPLFSRYFIDQIQFLIQNSGKDQGEAGQKSMEQKFKSWKTCTVKIPHYTSKISPFDVRAEFGAPIDWSQGSEEFVLLGPIVPESEKRLEIDDLLKLWNPGKSSGGQ